MHFKTVLSLILIASQVILLHASLHETPAHYANHTTVWGRRMPDDNMLGSAEIMVGDCEGGGPKQNYIRFESRDPEGMRLNWVEAVDLVGGGRGGWISLKEGGIWQSKVGVELLPASCSHFRVTAYEYEAFK